MTENSILIGKEQYSTINEIKNRDPKTWLKNSGWGNKRSRKSWKGQTGTTVEKFYSGKHSSVFTTKEGIGTILGPSLKINKQPKTWFDIIKQKARIQQKQTARGVTQFGKGVGKFSTKILNRPVKGLNSLGKLLLGGVKSTRRTIKSIPSPIKKVGGALGLVAGATAILGITMMKGAMNQARDIVYERYMQDQAVSKNILNSSRMGLSAGTSRMQNMGATVGLSNALSRTRHGR